MADTPVDRRRRFAKACDTCRIKKLGCDGLRPACSRCRRLGVLCHYADVEKPARRRRSSRARSRNVNEQARSDDGRHPRTPASSSTPDDPGTIVGDSRDMRSFGPSAWVPPGFPGTTHDQSLRHYPPKGSWSRWTHPSVAQVLERRTAQQHLPSWTEAFSLVGEFFDHDHKAIPCLHHPTFMTLLGWQYSDGAQDDPAWCVAFNAVLAIAQRRRLETGCSQEEDQVWTFASDALGSTLDVLMRSSCLLSVQALLLTAWFFVGTPNPQPAFMFVGNALRMAHSIGLHRDGGNCGSIESEMRKRVFWVAVSLDSQLCFQTGRPSTHHLHACHLELTTLNDDSGTLRALDGSEINMATAQAQLALIQGRISQELLSCASTIGNNSSTLSLDSITELNRQLDE